MSGRSAGVKKGGALCPAPSVFNVFLSYLSVIV
jgi:hypothetical protein